MSPAVSATIELQTTKNALSSRGGRFSSAQRRQRQGLATFSPCRTVRRTEPFLRGRDARHNVTMPRDFSSPPAMTPLDRALWRVRNVIFAPHCAGAAEEPLVVAGLHRAASGIGQAARSLADVLETGGRRVRRVDLSEVFGQCDLPADARLESMPQTAAGTLVLHVNAPETDRALLALRHFRPKRWRIIGVWAWETSRAPEAWRAPSRRLSEIWAPSQFAADAIKAVAEAPVRIAPHAVAAPEEAVPDRARFGLPDDALVFLAMADGRSSLHRKNPSGAIAAFRRALPDAPQARLIIKLRNVDEESLAELTAEAVGDPRIAILDAGLDDQSKWSLIASCDAFVSLHRAEGFGLPIAEAMALGKPVVATGWSGNMDFMNADNALPVGFRLTAVDDPTGRYRADTESVWAEPDIDGAADAMRRLALDENLRRRIGAAAARDAAALRQPALPIGPFVRP